MAGSVCHASPDRALKELGVILASISSMSVPRRAQRPLKLIAGLSEDQMLALEKALASSDPIGSPRELAERLEALGDPFTKPLAREVIAMLFSLNALHFTHGWAIDDITDNVGSSSENEFDEGERLSIPNRLSRLLKIDRIAGLAKAVDVAYDYGALFHTARVLTDLRPVFGDDPAAAPLGAVLIHTLKIGFMGDNGHEDFYVTLSDAELDELAEAIGRGKTKSGSLRRLAESTGLTLYDATNE